MEDLNTERKAAVRKAWAKELSYVREGKGTRDWTPSEQREIVSKRKSTGYEGHHMQSVKTHPQYAGNPNNIQFLSHKEHIEGAHKNNTKNAINGYYDPQSGRIHEFKDGTPQQQPSRQLSRPLTKRQQDNAIKREQERKRLMEKARNEKKETRTKVNIRNNLDKRTKPSCENQVLSKSKQIDVNSRTTRYAEPKGNKGLDSFSKKTTTQNTSSGQIALKSSNRGIQSFENGKSKASSASSAGQSIGASQASGRGGASGGQSSGSSGGQSSGGGQGR